MCSIFFQAEDGIRDLTVTGVQTCALPILPHKERRTMSMFIGEALVGDGNEIAHIDLLIGSKTGPVGTAFATALANQSKGHTNLLAVITPNLVCKPAPGLITKGTIEGDKQAGQKFRPPPSAVAPPVAALLAHGTIPPNQV